MRKILAALLALVMIMSVALVACQKDTEDTDADNDNEDDYIVDTKNDETSDTTGGADTTGDNTTSSNDFVAAAGDIWVMAKVNLRTEPSTSSSATIETTADAGTKLTALERNDSWYKISYNEKTLYVARDYVVTSYGDYEFTTLDTPLTLTIKPSNSTTTNKINLRSTPVVDSASDNTLYNNVAKTLEESDITADKPLVAVACNASKAWYKVTYDNQTYYLKITSSTKNIINGLPTDSGTQAGG